MLWVTGTKWTSASHQNTTCSRHDIHVAEKSVFGFRQQSITLAFPLLPVTKILPADFHCLNKVHQDITLVQSCA